MVNIQGLIRTLLQVTDRKHMAYHSALLHQVDCKHGHQKAIKAICLVGQAMLAHPYLYNRPSKNSLQTLVAAAGLPDLHGSSSIPEYAADKLDNFWMSMRFSKKLQRVSGQRPNAW